MDFVKTIVYFSLLLLVVLAYQNCAIYESGGKKSLESMIQKNVNNGCLPYLDADTSSQILNSGVNIRFNSNPPTGSIAQCDISSLTSALSIDNIVCGLANSYSVTASLQSAGGILSASQSNQIAMLNQDPSAFIEIYADPTSPLSGGSFAYSYYVDSKVVLRFLGANNSSSIGVACYIVFLNAEEFQDSTVGKTIGLQRLSDFVHAIVGRL